MGINHWLSCLLSPSDHIREASLVPAERVSEPGIEGVFLGSCTPQGVCAQRPPVRGPVCCRRRAGDSGRDLAGAPREERKDAVGTCLPACAASNAFCLQELRLPRAPGPPPSPPGRPVPLSLLAWRGMCSDGCSGGAWAGRRVPVVVRGPRSVPCGRHRLSWLWKSHAGSRDLKEPHRGCSRPRSAIRCRWWPLSHRRSQNNNRRIPVGLTIDVQIRVCPPAFLHCVMHHEHHVYTDTRMHVRIHVHRVPTPSKFTCPNHQCGCI